MSEQLDRVLQEVEETKSAVLLVADKIEELRKDLADAGTDEEKLKKVADDLDKVQSDLKAAVQGPATDGGTGTDTGNAEGTGKNSDNSDADAGKTGG